MTTEGIVPIYNNSRMEIIIIIVIIRTILRRGEPHQTIFENNYIKKGEHFTTESHVDVDIFNFLKEIWLSQIQLNCYSPLSSPLLLLQTLQVVNFSLRRKADASVNIRILSFGRKCV